MEIVYGPVSSWRLGKSLGVDLISSKEKICSFDCIYCQLGKQSKKTTLRKNFISIEKLRNDLNESLQIVSPDVITLSGMGEPTIAKNIDEAIKTIRKITKIPLAILTNSTLMDDKNVIDSLKLLDIVIAKIDASSEELFKEINQPLDTISFKKTIKSIMNFKKIYFGKLKIQVMFMKNNAKYAKDIANIVGSINPDEVYINTPLRPCLIKPLEKEQIDKIEKEFIDAGIKTSSVYKSPKPKTNPLDKIELIKRRRSEL